jgi:hypothetical protein
VNGSLDDNSKMRFNEFHSLVTNIRVFQNPFSVEVGDAPEKLQLELAELQDNLILHSSSNQKALITFYASLPIPRFSEILKLA